MDKKQTYRWTDRQRYRWKDEQTYSCTHSFSTISTFKEQLYKLTNIQLGRQTVIVMLVNKSRAKPEEE